MTAPLPVQRPVVKYFGGKWKLAPWVISFFPPHDFYVEPFGGGGSVDVALRGAALQGSLGLDPQP